MFCIAMGGPVRDMSPARRPFNSLFSCVSSTLWGRFLRVAVSNYKSDEGNEKASTSDDDLVQSRRRCLRSAAPWRGQHGAYAASSTSVYSE